MLIGLLICGVLFFLESQRRFAIPIRLQLVDGEGYSGYYPPLTAPASTTQPAPGEDYVADTWQEWAVTYRTGQLDHFDSRLTARPDAVVFDIAKSGEPATILIDFKVELKRALKTGDDGQRWDSSFHWWWSTPWQEVLRGEPLVTVLVDFRPAQAELSLSPMIFTGGENKVGDAKSWKTFIIFSGNPSIPSDASVIHLESSLAGKKSAAIQIINTQSWFLTQFYYPSRITGDPSPFTSERSRRGVVSPYGLNFTWELGQAGQTTFSWPTGVLTTDAAGQIVIVHTSTGTKILTVWKYLNGSQTVVVTATLAGPTATVTQVVATNRPGNATDESSGQKQTVNWIEAWLRGLMPKGFENLWWALGLVLGFVGLIVLAFILKLLSWALRGPSRGR